MTTQQDGLFRELNIDDPLSPTIGQCTRKMEKAIALANVTSDIGVKVEQWNEYCRLMEKIVEIIGGSKELAGRVALHANLNIAYEEYVPIIAPGSTVPPRPLKSHVVMKASPTINVNRLVYCRSHVKYVAEYIQGEVETVLLPKIEVKLPMDWIIEQTRRIVADTRLSDTR